MQTLYLGNIKNLLHGTKEGVSVTEQLKQRLSSSNLGLQNAAASGNATTLDSFNFSKNISDLLSPACGMTEEEKTSYFQRILAKLKSGKKLSAEEMRFLQAEYPEYYPQAARVQAMRDGLETRLKCCRSKEAARTMYADAMDSVSDNDPMKEYLVAAYQDVMREFEKSDEYKELPDTEEEARYLKKKINLEPAFEHEEE